MKYEAESPDEGALVEVWPLVFKSESCEAVGKLGWIFTGRTNEGLTVEVSA